MTSWTRWHERKRLEKEGFNRHQFFSRPELKARGWTDAMIRKFLPSEDATLPNPRYANAGGPMKLYGVTRVERLEVSREFQEAKRTSEKRKLSSQKAVETKLNKMHDYLDNLIIEVPAMEKEALLTASRRHFYTLGLPDSVVLSDERKCVNYLRHCLSRYEDELAAISGRVGAGNAYYCIKGMVLREIAGQYPWLKEECDNQERRMFQKKRHDG